MTAITSPVRLEVEKRLTAVLEEIMVVNGYQHDLSGSVYRGRLYFGDETPLPMMSILEPPITMDQLPTPKDSTAQVGPWELVLQGYVTDDRDNPTDPAHILLADVKKRLALEKTKTNWNTEEEGIFGLGRTVIDLYIGVGVVRPPDEISAVAYFWLPITLDIAEDFIEPYNA